MIDTENVEELDGEQAILDHFEDTVLALTVRLEALITRTDPVTPHVPNARVDRRPLQRKMGRIETGLNHIDTDLEDVPECTELNQFQEKLSDYKQDLTALYEDLVTRDIADEDELFGRHSLLKRKLSSVSQKLEGLLVMPPATAPTGITVSCLKACYDRPRLIQGTHVQAIIDAPLFKDRSGKELRKLHDKLQQHLRALSTLGCNLPSTFITSMIELKLDAELYSNSRSTARGIQESLRRNSFSALSMRAQASEISSTSHKGSSLPQKSLLKLPYHFGSAKSENKYSACKTEKHPLYLRAKFQAMSHDKKTQVCKTNR